jgi:hypothetical protein
MVRIVELDYLRVERQTLDPFMPDADGDSIPDGEEAYSWGYPLNPDPDEDGLDDHTELNLGTNPGMKDSDLDGIRDRLELGYSDTQYIDGSPWIDTPSKASWTERIQRDPHHNMMKPEDNSIKNWVDTSWQEGGGEPSFTDPLNPDSDFDGLPDGWRDGWTYNPTQTPPEGQKTTNLNNMRYGSLNYWRFNESSWGLHVDKLDNKVQIYEGEDLNGDGKALHTGHPWGFKTDTFESEGVDDSTGSAQWNEETDAASRDTDGDEMGDVDSKDSGRSIPEIMATFSGLS